MITDDIPLAARCIAVGARVLGSKGREFTEAAIGDALARRELLALLRDMGETTGGPAPLERKHRSQFLGRLDEIVQALRRRRQAATPGPDSGPAPEDPDRPPQAAPPPG